MGTSTTVGSDKAASGAPPTRSERASWGESVSKFSTGWPPPLARPCWPSETTCVAPRSTSVVPRAAVVAASAALASARRCAALALAASSVGRSAPAAVARSVIGCACSEAPGAVWPAVARRTRAGAAGDRSGPGGVFWIDSARRAEADATMAGLSAAGRARSRLRPAPTPAVPAMDLDIAIRTGAATGSPAPRSAAATAGLSTAVGEAATADCRAARDGRAVGSADGVMLGAEFNSILGVAARATCVLVDADSTSIACWLRVAPGSIACWRATVAAEGRGWSLGACVVAKLAATSAWTVVALGSAVVDCRRAGELTSA